MRTPPVVRTREATFDVWHEVPLVPQLSGMSCWAAAAAMIIGWRDCLDIDPEEVARVSGRWSEYREGMHPRDIDSFARTWGLHVEPAGALTVARLRTLLERFGPLWVGEASSGLHVIAIAGAFGDGTPEGTFVRVLDPWPEGRGERYTLTAAELLDSLHATVEMSGLPPLILHAGGRGRGASRTEYRVREEASAYVRFDSSPNAEEYATPRFGTPYGVLRHYHGNGNGGGGRSAAVAKLDDTDWYIEEDLRGGPLSGSLLTASDAAFADDNHSPDYRHLGHSGSSLEFELSGGAIRELFLVNGFDLGEGQDEVLFGLRGCTPAGDPERQGRLLDTVLLAEDLPDHVGYHCVLGVYRQSTNQLAVFAGSTVPNWSLMERQRAAGDEKIANLLPTGRYIYHVGMHRAVKGAFVLQPEVIVLRTRDNLIYEVTDPWEFHSPADNIHPGFTGHGALFSSAGCQTVPGRWTEERGHEGAWADFRIAAGLHADDRFGIGRTFVYCLLTGRDARLIEEASRSSDLARVRFGSRGDDVLQLQERLANLGLFAGSLDGFVDAATALALVRWQQQRDEGAADAIVTPEIMRLMRFSN